MVVDYCNTTTIPYISIIFCVVNLLTRYIAIMRELSPLQLLEECEARYDLLVNSVKDYAIFMLDRDGNITTWNPGAQKIKGYTKDEIINKHFSIFYTKESLQKHHPEYELEIAKIEGKFEEQGWRLRKDGSKFWANVVISAVYDHNKELVGFSKVTRDLTERKILEDKLLEANKELKKNEARSRLLVAGVKDYAIFLLSPEGNVLTWNEGAKQIKGYAAEEIIGQHFSQFYPPDAIADQYPQYELKRALKDGSFEDEGWRLRKDGSRFWANVVITPVLDEDKNHLGFTKVTRDLTERKSLEDELLRANGELRESEERMRLLIAGVKDYAIFMLTPEGNIATWNEGAKRIKGYEAEEIIGQHFSTFYTPESVAKQYPQFELKKALENERFEDEGWRIKKDGTRFWANVVIAPIYNGEKHIGFAKVTRDLSERVKNEELMKKNLELHKLNSDLDNFVYTASHDLKAPISNIEGLLEALLRYLSPESLADPRIHQVTEFMKGSIDRFKKTITNLADVIKLQKENNQEPSLVNLNDTIQEVILDIDPMIRSSNATIQTDLGGCSTIQFPPNHFRSIIYNLLSNAIKYHSPKRAPFVQIHCSQTEEYTVISVQDNGLGMKLPDTSKIFTMFKRLHTHVEGTGIGLFMVKRIIENAGGKIEVESELGKGSKFTIYIK